jgi:GTP cyclohydrolase II
MKNRLFLGESIQTVLKRQKLYNYILKQSKKSKKHQRIMHIKRPLLYQVLKYFSPALDCDKAQKDIAELYSAGFHIPTGSLIISNRGANLFSCSPRQKIPHVVRHIGFSVYVPGLGIETVNVGLVGNVYKTVPIIRTESACTPSMLFGSERCNCAHQWEVARELAANFNLLINSSSKTGKSFENWVQKQFVYKNGKHFPKKHGRGFVLLYVETQNGMGSGYTEGEFVQDLFNRASLRHRGEYSAEQHFQLNMRDGFDALGLTPDPRSQSNNLGYKITPIILDYLDIPKKIILLTNNPKKLQQVQEAGYSVERVATIGEVQLAGAQEAEQRKTDFGHFDINGNIASFEDEFTRLHTYLKKIEAKQKR